MVTIETAGRKLCFPNQALADAYLANQKDQEEPKQKSKQALAGKRGNFFHEDPWDLVIIGLDTEDDESHPLWDERAFWPLDESLVLNIMRYNVKEPVLVRKAKMPDGTERSEVVAGRQRVKAAREANSRLVAEGKEPLKVRTIPERGEDHLMFGVNISTNENRQDDTPLGRARKVQAYLGMGRTVEDAAVTFGRSTHTIQDWLKLLEMDPEVLSAIDQGKITAHAALKMAPLSRKEQQKALRNASKPKKTRRGRPLLPIPTKAILRKVVGAEVPTEATVNDSFRAGVAYALGLLTADKIKGLEEILG